MARTRKCLFTFFCGALLALHWSIVRADAPTEYEVKAALIHNIVKFVEWPDRAANRSRLRLCILGQSPFAETASLLQGKQAGVWIWEVRSLDFSSSLKECQVLFIAASESWHLRQILESINGSAVLTVADSNGFAAQGVMVNFYLEQNKVRFEINVEAAKRAGLRISSQLLKLARIVSEPGGMK